MGGCYVHHPRVRKTRNLAHNITEKTVERIIRGTWWIANKDNSESIIISALESLNELGKANQIDKYRWQIPPKHQEIFGEGKHWVYLYYFDRDKTELESQGSKVWQCKIGCTYRDPEKRIQEQTKKHAPIIALLLKTDEPVGLEKAIHGILTLCGKHLKEIQEKTQGREWFLTSPDEVVEIYHLIRTYAQRGY